jgi:hypothetical protein
MTLRRKIAVWLALVLVANGSAALLIWFAWRAGGA